MQGRLFVWSKEHFFGRMYISDSSFIRHFVSSYKINVFLSVFEKEKILNVNNSIFNITELKCSEEVYLRRTLNDNSLKNAIRCTKEIF